MPDYNTLALDAACGQAAAVVLDREGNCFEAVSNGDKPHSLTILPLLESALEMANLSWGDLQLLALGTGPGSFTGLRISASILAGLNTRLDLPLLTLSSLAVTALQTQSEAPLWILEDARAGDAYTGYFSKGCALQKDELHTWAAIYEKPVGTYACQVKPPAKLPTAWKRLPLTASRPRALAEAVQSALKSTDISSLPRFTTPSYLNRSQAERNFKPEPNRKS